MLGQQTSIFFNTILYRNNYLDYFIYGVAQILPFILFAIVIVYFLILKKDIFRFCSLILVILTSLALSEILKIIFSHPRPFLAISEFSPLFTFGANDSFPSGHATVFSALAVAVYFENKKLGILFGISALCIGVARVVSGVHYAHDILAGFIVGALMVIFAYAFIGKLRNRS